MEPRTEAGKRLFARFWETPAKDADRIGQIVAGLQRDILAIEEEARTVNPEGRSTDEDGLRAAIRAAFDATSVNADGIDWGCAGDLDGLATRLASALTTSSPGDELGAAARCVECGESWPCQATVTRRKDGIPHRAALTRSPSEAAIDVERLADVLTEAHLRRDGYCSESHRSEAEFVATRYLARLATPAAEPQKENAMTTEAALPFPTTDASKWAAEFVRLHGGDEGLMLAWFANAIEHGRGPDVAATPAAETEEPSDGS